MSLHPDLHDIKFRGIEVSIFFSWRKDPIVIKSQIYIAIPLTLWRELVDRQYHNLSYSVIWENAKEILKVRNRIWPQITSEMKHWLCFEENVECWHAVFSLAWPEIPSVYWGWNSSVCCELCAPKKASASFYCWIFHMLPFLHKDESLLEMKWRLRADKAK